MKLVQKTFTSFGLGIFVVSCGALLFMALSGWNIKALTVATGSMHPAIPKDSLALVKRVPASSLEVGDVITYTNPKNIHQTITHRITKAYKWEGKVPAFIVKGDANSISDNPIMGGQVRGKVVYTNLIFGKLLSVLKTWPGIILIIYIPSLLIIVEEIRRLASYYTNQIPYRVLGYNYLLDQGSTLKSNVLKTSKLTSILVIVSLALAIDVYALFQTNTVALTNNSITVKTISNQCSNQSSNNVNVSNTSTQTSNTGYATSNNNTNGGTTTSGNASSTNSTSININVSNC